MSKYASQRLHSRIARHERVRNKVSGTAERPRLCVRRSLKHIYAQLVDDTTGISLAQVASTSKEVLAKLSDASTKTDASTAIGEIWCIRLLVPRTSTRLHASYRRGLGRFYQLSGAGPKFGVAKLPRSEVCTTKRGNSAPILRRQARSGVSTITAIYGGCPVVRHSNSPALPDCQSPIGRM